MSWLKTLRLPMVALLVLPPFVTPAVAALADAQLALSITVPRAPVVRCATSTHQAYDPHVASSRPIDFNFQCAIAKDGAAGSSLGFATWGYLRAKVSAATPPPIVVAILHRPDVAKPAILLPRKPSLPVPATPPQPYTGNIVIKSDPGISDIGTLTGSGPASLRLTVCLRGSASGAIATAQGGTLRLSVGVGAANIVMTSVPPANAPCVETTTPLTGASVTLIGHLTANAILNAQPKGTTASASFADGIDGALFYIDITGREVSWSSGHDYRRPAGPLIPHW